jgi:amino acid permease
MQGKTVKMFDAFSTLINVLMGTGPILLPPVVAGAGVLLSAGVLIIMALLSFIGAEFIIESLSIANCIKTYGKGRDSKSARLINDADTLSPDV